VATGPQSGNRPGKLRKPTGDSAATAAGRAGALLDNANGVVTDLRAGKGTAGALLSRDELYTDLRELIRDLKRNPWKFFWKE